MATMLSIRLPPALMRNAKRAARARGVPLSELVRCGIRAMINPALNPAPSGLSVPGEATGADA